MSTRTPAQADPLDAHGADPGDVAEGIAPPRPRSAAAGAAAAATAIGPGGAGPRWPGC
ncbi:hypothetical protein [Nocardioides marinisabuli]|uniref:hypothetical protein n=1 Tax=Nocardioides marinisabuli TaxID=419476 RepID=UPI0015DEE82C|nr:hypothetical protein [Nocardioides marinisabuli]